MRISAVKCTRCGRLHEEDADSFYAVYGNICIGMRGGLVGNNITHDGIVKEPSIYCRNGCLAEVLDPGRAEQRYPGLV